MNTAYQRLPPANAHINSGKSASWCRLHTQVHSEFMAARRARVPPFKLFLIHLQAMRIKRTLEQRAAESALSPYLLWRCLL